MLRVGTSPAKMDCIFISRAFVKESVEIEPLSECQLSPRPNYVTAEGQALIETKLIRLLSAYANAQAFADRDALASVGHSLWHKADN